eukprot:gene32035-17540_t
MPSPYRAVEQSRDEVPPPAEQRGRVSRGGMPAHAAEEWCGRTAEEWWRWLGHEAAAGRAVLSGEEKRLGLAGKAPARRSSLALLRQLQRSPGDGATLGDDDSVADPGRVAWCVGVRDGLRRHQLALEDGRGMAQLWRLVRWAEVDPDYDRSRHACSSALGASPLGQGEEASDWQPGADDDAPWYQIDLKEPQLVAGVATRGEGGCWVETLRVDVSADGRDWAPVVADGGDAVGGLFPANSDGRGVARVVFPLGPAVCRAVRLRPAAWHGAPTHRGGAAGLLMTAEYASTTSARHHTADAEQRMR